MSNHVYIRLADPGRSFYDITTKIHIKREAIVAITPAQANSPMIREWLLAGGLVKVSAEEAQKVLGKKAAESATVPPPAAKKASAASKVEVTTPTGDEDAPGKGKKAEDDEDMTEEGETDGAQTEGDEEDEDDLPASMRSILGSSKSGKSSATKK